MPAQAAPSEAGMEPGKMIVRMLFTDRHKINRPPLKKHMRLRVSVLRLNITGRTSGCCGHRARPTGFVGLLYSVLGAASCL